MKKLLQMKFMLLLCALIVGSGTMWADNNVSTVSTKFNATGDVTSKFTQTGNFKTATWNLGVTWKDANKTYWGDLNTTKGTQIGSGSNPASQVVLTGSNIPGTISSVKVNTSMASGGTINVEVAVGGTAFKNDNNLTASLNTSATDFDFTGSGSGDVVITWKQASTSKAIYIKSITVTYVVASDSPLASITLSGDYPTSFTEGDEFSHEGMTVTATYEDESTADVTSSATFSGYDMTVLDQNQTVTVSYSEGEVTKTAEYSIIVNAIPTHSVTWSVNGTVTQQESYKEGAAITFPEDPAAREGKSFVGWATTTINGTTNTAPEFVSSATMGESNVTFYAVFATVEQSGENTYEVLSSNNFDANANYVIAAKQSATDATMWYFYSYDDKVDENASWGKMTTSPATVAPITFTLSGKADELIAQANTGHYLKGLSTGNFQMSASSQKIALDENGNIKSSNNTGSYALRHNYNNGNGGLRWYNGNTGQPANFYKVIPGTTYSGYCTTVVADTREEAGLSFTESTKTVEWYSANQYTGQALTNPHSVSPITWTSSNEGVATVENDGTVTVLALGETTIKASFDGDNNYKKGEASYTLTVQDTREEPTVTINHTFITHTDVHQGTAAGHLTASVKYNDETIQGATVTWSGDNDAVATINATSGSVDLVAPGTVTFTAAYAGNEYYSAKTATYEMTVTDSYAPGTVNNPYTVALALENTPSSGTSDNVYIRGIVSAFYGDYTDITGDYSHRYYISDDGTTTNQLLVYNGKGLNNVAFSNASDLQIGDVVTILGGLTTYNSTKEVAKDNYIVSLKRAASITVADATINVDASSQGVTRGITVENLNISDMSDFAIQYYDADGNEDTQPNWIEAQVTEQDGYILSCSLGDNTGEERTAYLKVYAMDGNDFVYSNLVTITQEEYVPVVSHTATFSINGTTSTADFNEGANINFPNVEDQGVMKFMGWTTTEIVGTEASADYINEDVMGDGDVTYYAVFALLVAPGTTSTVTDELTNTLIKASANYSLWENITATSDAVYKGNSAGGYDAIQLRTSNSNSGIVTTTSGGKLKKVTVEWNGNTANDRTLDIYGKNTAYSAASDLYGTNTQGTKIGSIVCGTSTELTISGDYTFIGLRSNSNAMYLDKITIEWETGTPDTYSDYCTTIPAMLTVTIAEACTDGSKYYGTYSSSSAFKVPANVTVSEIGITAEGKMNVQNYASGAIVPANTGVMVSATTFGEHKLIISSEEGTSVLGAKNRLRPTGDNALTATEMNSAVSETCKFYRLTMHGAAENNPGKIGFWWGADGGNSFNIAANKAYLAVPASVAGARNGFAFGDDATGINNVNVNENVNGSVFDLQGRKVSTPGKGLYIVNGKKVVIK